jgi:hypothetical protein
VVVKEFDRLKGASQKSSDGMPEQAAEQVNSGTSEAKASSKKRAFNAALEALLHPKQTSSHPKQTSSTRSRYLLRVQIKS